ncbi:MAG: DEAD/DEAH box helicase [Myxococcota bacterium]
MTQSEGALDGLSVDSDEPVPAEPSLEKQIEDTPSVEVEALEAEAASETPSEERFDGSFDEFPINPEIREAIREMGFERPTKVQNAVIKDALAGLDLVVQSKTGSGKTCAFGIPVVQKLAAEAPEPKLPKAMVIAPTRELANQVAEEIEQLAANTAIEILPVYGGVPINKQAKALERGVHLVVGTPGRILDHVRRRNLDLSELQMFVLDEADEMLSMGFWDDVTAMLGMAPESRQTMLFSATLPYQVAKAAAQYLKEPSRIDVSGDELTVDGIDNVYYTVQPSMPKPRQLLYQIEVEKPTTGIIFCNTRNETEMIAKYLTQSGLIAEPLSGAFKQKERDRVMKRIRDGDLRFMVATDIAARGIDISHLSHVFNYSLPEFTEVYLHRVGRTGRMEKKGVAVSLVDGKGLTTLTQLQRQFGIEFIQRELPPEEQASKARSERIMKELAEKASVAEVGLHRPVADEILASDEGAQIVAFLLKTYYGQAAADAAIEAKPKRTRRAAVSSEEADEVGVSSEDGSDDQPKKKRRRRRRRRRRGEDNGLETMDAAEALGIAPRPSSNGDAAADAPASANGKKAAAPAPLPEVEEGMTRIKINIGFDDGFKGRGAIAKKISSLAGLNDGIVTEVESKRHHCVLKATPEIAELVVERVDGAQIGKKVLEVAVA